MKSGRFGAQDLETNPVPELVTPSVLLICNKYVPAAKLVTPGVLLPLSFTLRGVSKF